MTDEKRYYDETDDIAAYWSKRYVNWYKNPQWHVLAGKAQWFEIRFAHLLPPISDHPTGSVLDYGCGNAMYALPLLNHFENYTGFDTSETALEIAVDYYSHIVNPPLIPGNKISLVYYDGDPGAFSHITGPYDLVVSITVLQHQPASFRLAMIENIKSLLKPGGRYIGLEWNEISTGAYDMPGFSKQAWIDAWKPLEIAHDIPAEHPDWAEDHVWYTR
jgi:SAM-dependent methyltransferase